MTSTGCLVFADRTCAQEAERFLRGPQPVAGRTVALDDDPSAIIELHPSEVPSDVMVVLRTRDESLSLFGNDAPPIRESVSAPLSQVFRLTRTILERWMEEGVGGVVTVVLLVSQQPPTLTEAALAAFVRSVSKEHGRRGVRALLLVSTDRAIEEACDAWRILRSPMAALITGETIHVAPGGSPPSVGHFA